MDMNLDTEKKKLADTENDVDGDMIEEDEEDMDEDEVNNIRKSNFPNDQIRFFFLYFRLQIILNLILIQVIEMMMI